MRRSYVGVVLVALGMTSASSVVLADGFTDESPAEILLSEGLKFQANAERGKALLKFRSAFVAAEGGDSLLAIASALFGIGQISEAMTVYEKYLDSPNVTRRRRRDIQAKLRELAGRVGSARIYVEPKESQLEIDGLLVSTSTAYPIVVRVDVGKRQFSVAKPGFVSQIRQVEISLGGESEFEIKLTPLVKTQASASLDKEVKIVETSSMPVAAEPVKTQRMPWEIATRKKGIGVSAGLRVDIESGGTAGTLGISYSANQWISASASVLIGSERGGHFGARGSFWEGEITPTFGAGATVFSGDEGVDVGIRATGGLVWVAMPQIWLVGDIGVEYYPKGSTLYRRTLLVPALSVEGHL